MSVAAIWGSTIGYQEVSDSVWIETNCGRVAVIRKNTFDYLYRKLDDFTAALKGDCMEYTLLSDEHVELINFRGDVKYMELDDFNKYYDTLGG